jgi:hypothetical protein
MMLVKVKLSALAQGHWYEYGGRFVLGGTTTVLAGLIAAEWGPVVGGLFLAFPAIFPASATLVEKHEREKKEKRGLKGTRRGREAAALEARGAIFGSFGLAIFALIIWQMAPSEPLWALAAATVAWTAVSVLAWLTRRHFAAFVYSGQKRKTL